MAFDWLDVITYVLQGRVTEGNRVSALSESKATRKSQGDIKQ